MVSVRRSVCKKNGGLAIISVSECVGAIFVIRSASRSVCWEGRHVGLSVGPGKIGKNRSVRRLVGRWVPVKKPLGREFLSFGR